MDSIRDRARQNFPSVLLTLLSIVQAIAFESLWEHSRNRSKPGRTGFVEPNHTYAIYWRSDNNRASHRLKIGDCPVTREYLCPW